MRTTASPSTWIHLAKLVNFFGYDSSERRRMTIGPGVLMPPTVSVRNGANISIGRGAHIGQWTYLWAGADGGRIDIGENAGMGPGTFITASNYDFDAGDGNVMELPKIAEDITIGRNAWLGARVVVVAGVSIGEGTIVAAGSVVSRDLPAYCVAAGVPARVIRRRGEAKGAS